MNNGMKLTGTVCDTSFQILEKIDPELKNIQILKCHRKKRYVNGQKRPIIAKFSINDRDNICSKKGNLKGSNLFIAEDFPLEIEQNRRILLPVFRHARTIESLKGKVSLKVDKLVIDGRTYTVDTLNKLPPSLNPFTYSARQNETVLVFHGTSSPLANSYPCAFKENGITFNNVEQYMYYHKALTAGDDIARLTKAYDVTIQRYRNLHAKIEDSKIHILRCMGSKFCVKFQRFPLKFHTKFWTHTTQNMHFTRC